MNDETRMTNDESNSNDRMTELFRAFEHSVIDSSFVIRVSSFLFLFLFFSSAASACPFCADTIHNTDSSSASTLGSAMNLSIYCMFMGLFVAFGIVARAIMKGIRS